MVPKMTRVAFSPLMGSSAAVPGQVRQAPEGRLG
jgi:hypothetical protein